MLSCVLAVMCCGYWLGEGQYGKTVAVCLSVTLDADEAAEGGGSGCTSHDGLK
jgi:hypothetical protein